MRRAARTWTLSLAVVSSVASPRVAAAAVGVRAGVLPLMFTVPPPRMHIVRRDFTAEVHATLDPSGAVAGGGVRVQGRLWPSPRSFDYATISLVIGGELGFRYDNPAERAWRVQVPVLLQVHVALDPRWALFLEAGSTPEFLPGERRAFAAWPTIAAGVYLQIGSMGRDHFGVGPPYHPPPEALNPRRPPAALVLRVGFPAGVQLGVAF